MSVSIVIPLLTKKRMWKSCMSDCKGVLESYGSKYEIIFVDDGSTDNTLGLLEEIQKRT